MIIQKWMQNVAKGFQANSHLTKIIISAKGPLSLTGFVQKEFDPKKHDVALCIRFIDSPYVLFIESAGEVPMHDVIDPGTGRYWIKYDKEDQDGRFARIE